MFNAEAAKNMNLGVVEEFRANGGKVGGNFAGAPLLLLTTTGSKTGRTHTIPLVYLPDGGRIYIFGSKAGAPDHPAWYNNLVADPKVTVELGTEKFEARARLITGAERDRIYAHQAAIMPNFAEYQQSTTRVIPVVELVRV